LADDPDNEYAMIDATIARAHQHSAGARKKKGVNQAIGRSRGGLTTKIHMIVDALGNPLAFTLTAGQVHDITQAETLTSQVQPEALLADTAAKEQLKVHIGIATGIVVVGAGRTDQNRGSRRKTDDGPRGRHSPRKARCGQRKEKESYRDQRVHRVVVRQARPCNPRK
jgi:hypothetical protein